MDETTPLNSKARRPPLFVYFATGCAALNSVNLGFDIGVNSGVAVLIEKDFGLSAWEVGMFMGSLHLISGVVALFNSSISDTLGRRYTFAIAQVFCLIGLAILCQAQSFNALMLGRVFLGGGVGISLAVDPLYIAEIAPATHRGSLTTWSEISINFGIMIGFLVNWVFADLPLQTAWRVMLGVGAILPVLILALATIMPESPRYLMMQNRETEAQEVIRRSHHEDEDISHAIRDIQKSLAEDAESQRVSWSSLLCPDQALRKMLTVGVGIAFAQQINGGESVVLYSPHIFLQAGVATTHKDLFALTLMVGIAKTGFIVISACFLDGVGRRPLLLLSTCSMAVCQFGLSYAIYAEMGWLAAACVLGFVSAFSIGIGPICWLLAAEVFPIHLRAKGLSLATLTNRLTSSSVAWTFLPLSKAMSLGGYFGMFACITSLTAIWSFLVVPETRQRSLEQITEDFQKTV